MSTSHSNGTGSSDGAIEVLSEGAADPQVVPGNSEFGNRYPGAFKLKVLEDSDACTKPGELGKYLRRMGLTHATLTCFRKQRSAGTLGASVSTKPSRGTAVEQTRRLMELERENRKLRRQLEQAEAVIDIQKKVSRLLEISLDAPESAGNRRNG
jgi:transposase